MSKAIKVVVATAVLAGGALCGASWFAGGKIQQQMQDNLTKITTQLHGEVLQGELTEYNRGLFSSEMKSRWNIVLDKDFHLQYQATHKIAHAPWHLLGKMNMQSQFWADKNSAAPATKSLAAALGDKPFAEAQSTFTFSGQSEHHFQTQPLEKFALDDELKISIAPITGQWRVEANAQALNSQMELPRLSLEDEDMRLTLENIRYEADNNPVPGHDLWMGKGQVLAAKMTMEDVEDSDHKITAEDFKITSEIALENADTAQNTSERNAFLTSAKMLFELNKITEIEVGEQSHEWASRVQLNADLQHLDGRALHTLMSQNQKIEAEMEKDEEGNSKILNTAIGQLLESSPAAQFKLDIQSKEFPLQSSFDAAFSAKGRKGADLIESFDMDAAQNIALDFKLKAPHIFWDAFDEPADTVAELELMGILRSDDSSRHLHIQYKDGSTRIHGEEVDTSVLFPLFMMLAVAFN